MITLTNITKHYGAAIGVDNISFEVGEGEIAALLGPSGCGKTTTLRLIAGFEKPDDGEIAIGQHPVSSSRRMVPPFKRGIGMVFQDLALWPHLTVSRNIGFALEGTGLNRQEKSKKIAEVLAMVQLPSSGNKYPSELSGGEQQRVALARALAPRPDILLFDEPLANLDPLLKKEILDMLFALHDKLRFTLIYATHGHDEVLPRANRIIIMNRGRIEQTGTAREVQDNPATEFVRTFLSRTNLKNST